MAASVTATFVFTDLVDSTATAARLGREAAEELRQTHFGLLRGAVGGSGGVEVKNLGDGLMVMYSSPSRALSGAAGMQQAIEHHNRAADQPLGVRIGISGGEAVEEDGDYFGDPVVEAARLCAAAQGGQILATDLVRALVGRHATQTFVEVGPLELKGLPDPVDVVEVVWEPIRVEGSVPLPGRLVGAASDALFGFFGRAPEMELIGEIRKRALSSQRCQVVLVAGEAGMGKTSLVAQAARAAHADGSIVLFGHADEGLGVAYQPWIEIIAGLIRYGDGGAISRLPSAQRGALARLVPEIGVDGDRVGDPDTERLLLLEGATELVVVQSQTSPVLLVLDDLHWADTASLQVLRHLIASSTPMNVTVACTYRDTDLGRGDPLTFLLSDLHREANVTRVALKGLEDTDVVELFVAAAGHDLDDDGVGLAHEVRRETDGNPFFTSELLRHLGESGGIVQGEDGRWTLAGELDEIGLPNSVRDVVGRRVARLGDDALRVLSLAAVIGREFDLELLTELADIDEGPLLDLMEAAAIAALLVEDGDADRYRFAHGLIQHALYDELSPTRRQRAHKRIAEALEFRTGSADAAMLAELAHHWVAATRPADAGKALEYVRRAGDAALDALAPDDAIRWYQQALDLFGQLPNPNDHNRAELLAKLGTAQRRAGSDDCRENLLSAARLAERFDDSDLLVEIAFAFAHGDSLGGDEDAKRIAQIALDRIGTTATPSRARMLATLAGAHDATFESDARRSLTLEALDVARQTEDESTLVEVIYLTRDIGCSPDRREVAIAEVEQAVASADTFADPRLQISSRFWLIWARYAECDVEGVDTAIAEMERITERVGLPLHQWELRLAITGRLLRLGLIAEAEAANERTLEAGLAAGRPESWGTFGGVLYNIRLHQGRLDEVAEVLFDAARDAPSITALRAIIPALLCELGRIDEARERLAAEATISGFDFPFEVTWLNTMMTLLDAAATTKEAAIAQDLIDRTAPFATHVVAPTSFVMGAIARPLARAATILGQHGQAEEWFTTAHDIHHRLQARFWTARGELDHADLCLARRADGDVERARQFATTAETTATQYGCAGLTKRANNLLAQI